MEHIAILKKDFDKLMQCVSLSILIKSILYQIFNALDVEPNELLLSTAKDIAHSFKDKRDFVWELEIEDIPIRVVFSKQYDDWFASVHFTYWVEKTL